MPVGPGIRSGLPEKTSEATNSTLHEVRRVEVRDGPHGLEPRPRRIVGPRVATADRATELGRVLGEGPVVLDGLVVSQVRDVAPELALVLERVVDLVLERKHLGVLEARLEIQDGWC